MLAGTLGRVQSPRVIRIGGGVAREIAEVLAQLGLSRPLIVTDPGHRALGHVDDDAMLGLMARQAFASGLPANNPRVPTEAEIVNLYKEMW